MTREEAIKILSCRDNRGVPIAWQDGFVDAVDTAIEALSTDIVRCKDCEYGDAFGYREIYCTRWDKWEMPKDGFCFEGCLPEIMTPPTGETDEKEKRSKRTSL